jgi:hypothetical protein
MHIFILILFAIIYIIIISHKSYNFNKFYIYKSKILPNFFIIKLQKRHQTVKNTICKKQLPLLTNVLSNRN